MTNCLFLEKHPCEKEHCEICPIYYDWAVYEIHNKEEDECPYMGGECVMKRYICWDCEFATYFPYLVTKSKS